MSLEATVPAEVEDAPAERAPGVRRGFGWFWNPVRSGIGALLMQTPVGAVMVLGWLQRFLQRAIYRSWWKRCRGRLGRFEEFAEEEPALAGFRQVPNWCLAQEFRTRWRKAPVKGRVRWRVGALVGSAGRNVAVGLRTWLNLGLLTLPGAVFWAFGWWGGWQNSFHKGYEHALVGPLVSWLGILLFIGAMFYVPMALARQAATGRWQGFWEGRKVWALVKVSWLPSAVVAVLFALANVVAMGLKSWPQFLPELKIAGLAERGLEPAEAFRRGMERVDWSQLTEDQALVVLNVHYLVSALVVFVMLVALKWAQAWLYAGAVLKAVRRGVLGEEDLSEVEGRLLRALGALVEDEEPGRGWLFKAMAWTGTRVGRLLCGTIVFLGWFGFVAAVYVSEFLTYHPGVGWLNQPLVQLPWFRYVPAGLEDPIPGLALLGIVVGVAGWVACHRSRRNWLAVKRARREATRLGAGETAS